MSLTLKIAELGSTPTTLRSALASDWCAERLAGVYRAVDTVFHVTITASRAAEVIEVDCTLHGRVGFDCSRCAEPAELAVDTEFQHHFVGPGQLDAGDDTVVDRALDADPDVSEHDGVHLALADLCIEHAILALPVAPLCDEDCRGLCPRCGTNRNREACSCSAVGDPASPWASLQGIKIELKA